MKWVLYLELLTLAAFAMAGLWSALDAAEAAFRKWLARRMGVDQ